MRARFLLMLIVAKLVIKIHKLLCPFWELHVAKIFSFMDIDICRFCKYCPLANMRNVGRAYRKTIGVE